MSPSLDSLPNGKSCRFVRAMRSCVCLRDDASAVARGGQIEKPGRSVPPSLPPSRPGVGPGLASENKGLVFGLVSPR